MLKTFKVSDVSIGNYLHIAVIELVYTCSDVINETYSHAVMSLLVNI